jgi:RNA polymerase sigma-70 factor (ECF subfamily)
VEPGVYQEVVLARSRIVAPPITARPARARVVASAPMPDDPPEIASDLGPAEAMAVAMLLSRATEAWPEVAPAIGPAQLGPELRRRLAGGPTTAWSALHHDVVLAVAACAGAAWAVAEVDRIAGREVSFAAGRLRATSTQADDVRGELRRLLFTGAGPGEPDRPAAITTFAGRGDLRGYARVIVSRALAHRIQRDRRLSPMDDDFADVLSPALDPDVALMREQYRGEVDRAFRTALGELTDRERAVLRYHLIDGWSIDQIGDRYGVHRATAARWVTGARASLGDKIRLRLAEQLAIDPERVDSIVAMVTSRVEVSLDRLLGADADEPG